MKDRRAAAGFARLVLALLVIFAALQPPTVQAVPPGERLQVAYVYGEQCLSCQHAWPEIRQALDESPAPVSLSRYEITTREGTEYASAHGIRSVPAVVVNCGPATQLEDYKSVEAFSRAVRERIACETGTGPCGGMARHSCAADPHVTRLSAPAAFAAGLIAGFNPCLLAVLGFIAGTTLSAVGRKLGVLARIMAFCAGLLTVYLLIGVGLIGLIGRVPGLEAGLKLAVIAVLGALAAWSLVDAYRTKKGSESRSFRAVLGWALPFYRRYGVPASYLIGAAFGLVKMPCVGGLYIAILGTILQAGHAAEGIAYLVIYNLGVIAPVLALGLLIVLGLSPEEVKRFRLRYRVELKAFTGFLLAAMAAGFVLGLI